MKDSVIFEGEVNGVKVNTVKEYNNLIAEHTSNGTLKSASSSTRVEKSKEFNPQRPFDHIDPKFHSMVKFLEAAAGDKYLTGSDNVSRFFYKDFQSELNKFIKAGAEKEDFKDIAKAIDSTAEFCNQSYDKFAMRLSDNKDAMYMQLYGVVDSITEEDGQDFISLFTKNKKFQTINNEMNKNRMHMKHCTQWGQMYIHMVNKLAEHI